MIDERMFTKFILLIIIQAIDNDSGLVMLCGKDATVMMAKACMSYH
jgi:hypothetical protein